MKLIESRPAYMPVRLFIKVAQTGSVCKKHIEAARDLSPRILTDANRQITDDRTKLLHFLGGLAPVGCDAIRLFVSRRHFLQGSLATHAQIPPICYLDAQREAFARVQTEKTRGIFTEQFVPGVPPGTKRVLFHFHLRDNRHPRTEQ